MSGTRKINTSSLPFGLASKLKGARPITHFRLDPLRHRSKRKRMRMIFSSVQGAPVNTRQAAESLPPRRTRARGRRRVHPLPLLLGTSVNAVARARKAIEWVLARVARLAWADRASSVVQRAGVGTMGRTSCDGYASRRRDHLGRDGKTSVTQAHTSPQRARQGKTRYPVGQ